MKKISLFAGIGLILLAMVLLVGVSFYPSYFGFMERVVCPPGARFDEHTARRNFSRRRSSVNCVSKDWEHVDVTGRLLLTALVPVSLGLPLIIFWAWKRPSPGGNVRGVRHERVTLVKFESDE